MAFYDENAESNKTLSPLQRALLLPPDAILHHQDLLTSIAKTSNFSDEKAEYILDILLKNISESLTYNNPQTSTTSLIILDYAIRNGNIFAQYVFGRYILQKLYTICCRDLTKVTSNHKAHQDFQYRLIGTILQWHQMFTNVNGSTINYTFSRLQKSGILALYQSYKQTQKLFDNADSQLSHATDEKNQARARAMTTDPTSQQSNTAKESRPRSKSANDKDINYEALIHRDGRVKLEYTEKFQNEVNELIARYLKPTREILSRQKINLANKKLQKYLQILQVIQQRLVKVISEVKNEDTIVSLAIKANDCIVCTILWFNSLVKKSKGSRDVDEQMGKSVVSKSVIENIDLVGLEQQLLLDNANVFKRKQLRDLKEQKQKETDSSVKKVAERSENVPVSVSVSVDEQMGNLVDLISGDTDQKVAAKGSETKEEKSGDSAPVSVVVSSKDESDGQLVSEVKGADTSMVSINVSDNNNGNAEEAVVTDLLNLNVDSIVSEKDITVEMDMNVSGDANASSVVGTEAMIENVPSTEVIENVTDNVGTNAEEVQDS